MDKVSAARIRAELDALLDHLREKGVAAVIGRGLYTDTQITFKVTIAEERPDGLVMTKEAGDFQRLAVSMGMRPEWLGRVFYHCGKKYRLLGYYSRRRKYPILVQEVATGKKYKFTKMMLTDSLARANSEV